MGVGSITSENVDWTVKENKRTDEQRLMKRVFHRFSNRLTAVALGGAVILAGSAVAFTQKPKPTPVKLTVDERPIARDESGRNSFAPVVKKVTPGVVKVFATAKLENTAQNGRPQMDDFMRRFFGDPFEGRSPRGRNFGMPRQQGIGSGVIVTRDGYILTNNHVVDGAQEVKVALQDGREFEAKIVGRDPKTDVAVIKIDGKDLPAVPMADSDKVEVGDLVLAIGNPFGIGQTVTTGIVSATGRGNMGLDYEDFIQTDAAINPGNSGGALVDAEGRLIGINTAILSRTGGNQGIGFAIPANLARDVMESLIQDGRVTRGYMGVMIQDVTPALAREFKLQDGKGGALVGDVTPKGPAEKAGIQSGDVITEFNGKRVADSRQLKLEAARAKPGETVPVKVLRDGSTKTLEVTVKEMPGAEKLARAESDGDRTDSGTLNGVAVSDLNNNARQELGLPANLKGAVVTEVEPDSAAAEAGLRPGDVILEINRKPVKNADEAVQMTENAGDKTTLLRVYRNGGTSWVVVDESKAG
jgi:serine protease Do